MKSTLNFVPHKQERLFLLTLAGIQFTHVLDFMIMMPLGPQFIRTLQINTREFGLLLSSYSFAAAVFGLLSSAYIDRFDRRKLTLGSYLLFILATLLCGLAPNYPMLLGARALSGAFGGMLGALVQTMIADTIPFERRGKAMGMVMASFSVSTVAGVPLGLLLANHLEFFGWCAPFFFIVLLSLIFLVIGWRMLPSLTHHLEQGRQADVLAQIMAVAMEPAHVTAFAFMGLTIMSSLMVIPYIALYLTSNVGMSDQVITVMYLCGGAATFFTAPWFGRLADRHGKLPTFRAIAIAAFVPILFTTHMTPVPVWLVLINSTAFFVLVSGRMIPGMAMITAVAQPQVRGAFMSLVSSTQMLAAGTASLLSGLIITRTATGQIEHYNLDGYIALAFGLMTLWMAGRLRVAQGRTSVPQVATREESTT